MAASIDNLVNVNFIKGDINLLNFGLMLGGSGQHKPYVPTPADLFLQGEEGAFYLMRRELLFQDAAGTTPVTAGGDPAGRALDQSGNNQTAIQTISARRPVYNATPDRLSLDKVDDALIITVPVGGWNGTMVLATDDGTASYGISIDAGEYELGGQYFPGTAIVGALFRDGALTDSEKTDAEGYFVGNGSTASYGGVSNFYQYWRGRVEVTSLPLIDTSNALTLINAFRECKSITSFPLLNVANCIDFTLAFYNCNALTSFPLLDVSSATNFQVAWANCSALTVFPANFFDNIKGGNFNRAFEGTNLNEASIDGILVSLVTSGITTGDRIFSQTGGSAPSVGTGQPAIDTLRSRGWTVTVTGGY